MMSSGRPRVRGDNQQGLSFERQQAHLTWGGVQLVNAGSQPAGTTLFFPFPVPAFQIPNIATFDQLVDMRYERPTSWQVDLFIEGLEPMQAGDEIRMLWDVNVSVGKAKNTLRTETAFTKIAVPIAPAAQSTLVSLQLAAETIQIIPEAMSIHWAVAAHIQIVRWSAWVAPIVD